MKIKLQRMVAMFLLMLLILPMLTSNAFATEYSNILSEKTKESLKILSAYGLIDEANIENFSPGNCITRAEIAKISAILLGYEKYTEGMTSNYSDMQGHWAERYVDIINELGILKGYDNDTYKPDENITYEEAITAILKVLGYNDPSIIGNNPNNYVNLAKNLGLLKDIDNPSIYMTRESLVNFIYNALFTSTVKVNRNKFEPTKKLLLNNIGKKETVIIDDIFAFKHPYLNLRDYLLNTCDVYYNIDGKIVLIENPLYKVKEGDIKSVVSKNVIFFSDNTSSPKIYDLSNIPVIFNGVKSKVTNEDLKNSRVRLIMDNKDSDKAIAAVVEKITDKTVIDATMLYKEGDKDFAGKNLPKVNGKISIAHVKVTGAVNSIYDIEEDDVVYFYEAKEKRNSGNILMIDVVRKSVSGVFYGKANVSYEDIFAIGIQYYRLSSDFIATEIPSEGDSIKAILDSDNKIYKANILKYIKVPETYGMIIDIENRANGKLPVVTLINQYGKTVKLELRENSGGVYKEIVNRIPEYKTDLSRNTFVKYDLFNNNSIKIIERISNFNIAGDFNNKTGALVGQGGIIGLNTVIVQQNNNGYNIIKRSSLGDYIEGKAVFNSDGIAEIFVLEKNIFKTQEYTTAPDTRQDNPPVITNPPVVDKKFTGKIYGAIQTISGSSGSETVKLFNYSNTYNVDKNLKKSLKNYKNQYVELTIVKDVVTDIVGYSAEISKSKVTAIYSGQLQIDGISYVEYSKDVKVFTCSYDSKGNITSFSEASLSDIKINSSLKFYNTNKNYNGVMDVIIIYN